MPKIEIGPIRYNAATSAYEARVDIARKGGTYRYPCSVPGTLTMGEDAIRQSLAQQARYMASLDGNLLSVR